MATKVVEVEKEVRDMASLFMALIREKFEVTNVAVHGGRTLVHLEEEEDKNPIPVIESFLGSDPKVLTSDMARERREMYQKYLTEKPERMEKLRARYRVTQEVKSLQAEASGFPDREPEVLAMGSPEKKSWITRLRELF